MPKITLKEFEDRRGKITSAMLQNRIDCLILLPGTNFYYLTGLKFARERYRLLAAILFSDSELTIMGPSFEETKMNTGLLEAQVHIWTDEENQYRRVVEVIKSKCGPKARVGLEMTINYYHYLAFRAELPGAEFVDPTPATDEVRALKSEAEIECLREAAARTRARMEKAPSQMQEGMTEAEFAEIFGGSAMVQFGPTTSLPNETAGNRKLRSGDVVIIDAGDRVEGYRSDLTRTFFFGKPSKKMREIYTIVNEAELAAIEAVKPGEPAETIDLAARAVIERAGYGDYFTHRGGHGLGLDFHELPICATGNKNLLRPGMVIACEPGIYVPGEFGVRLEDNVIVREKGHELLSERGPLYFQ